MNLSADRLRSLTAAIFEAAGCDGAEAVRIAEHLVEANLAGHDSHGVIRVPSYVQWLRSGKVLANQHIDLTFENDVIAVVDGVSLKAVPRIWLPAGFDVQAGSFLTDEAGAAARALRAFVGAGLANGVTWARIRQGELTLGTRSGLELRLGAPVDLPLKIAVVQSIAPTLALPSAGGPTYLDVSVPERPVAGTNSQVVG